ncbi:MAG TPA: glutathione peroxidase [Cyclobacteriaceae bacterium]
MAQKTSFHDFEIKKLNSDETLMMSEFKGKYILAVNVASECGYTPQYEELQKLSKKYENQLVVIGFPSNQFGGQEPGSESVIQSFCKANFGVSFPMTTKIDVKGKDQHEIYQWLTQKEKNGKDDYVVTWNFNKFLINKNGQLVSYFPSSVNPLDASIIENILN